VLGVTPGGIVSGAETVLLRDLAAAQDAGWTVRLACADGVLVQQAAAAGIERIAVPDLRLPTGPKAIAAARMVARATRAAWELRRATTPGEVIIANGLNTLPVLGVVARRSPIVYFAHDVIVRRDRIRLLRRTGRFVQCAIAVSEAVAGPLRELGMRTTVVLNGTPWPVEPAPPPSPDAPPVVGISAVLTPWKGHEVLLDAFARLQSRAATLEIMGGVLPKDDEYARRLRARAEQPDLRGRVHFLGHVDDPIARMRTWRVAVSASVDPEAGPLTTLEAMSVGVALVATDHGGVIEVLGAAGLLVAPRDAGAMAVAIDRLLSDRALWETCRAAGPRLIVEQRLTEADQQARWLDALDSIVT
jgi:glycosyltransferase involved in cell wall biosynthesis